MWREGAPTRWGPGPRSALLAPSEVGASQVAVWEWGSPDAPFLKGLMGLPIWDISVCLGVSGLLPGTDLFPGGRHCPLDFTKLDTD